jgi:hypothetical protein
VAGSVAQISGFGERLKFLERLVLDLADPLAGDVERAPDRVERTRVLATEAVAHARNAAAAASDGPGGGVAAVAHKLRPSIGALRQQEAS